MSEHPDTPVTRSHRKTLIPIIGVVLGMTAMAWAAVPLYDLFCRVTGYGGTTQQVASASDRVLDQSVTVRFDASLSNEMAWEFSPSQTSMEVRIGETGLAFYEAYNPTSRPITGTASFNVTPLSVGGYFAKIECFCFQEQTLQPGERVQMPVTFYVDPDMVDDATTARVHTITLSYTFFETEPAEAAVVPSETAARGG
ncbi:MAG: cytochrome c oxidase assembly protein [Pseudomonadota bacterium]